MSKSRKHGITSKQQQIPLGRNRASWQRPVVAWAMLGLAVLVCYAGTLDNVFVYDDIPYILENEIVNGAMPAASAFVHSYPPHQPRLSLYRPLPEILYAMCWNIGLMTSDRAALGLPPRPDPWPFHAANLLLHWLVCGLIFHFWRNVARRMSPQKDHDGSRDFWAALAAALLFAVHPAHVENVAALAGTVDLMATAFALGAIMLLCCGVGEQAPRWPRVLAGAACFLFALLSKENAAVVPLILAVIFFAAPFASDRSSSVQSAWRARRVASLGLALLPLVTVLIAYLAVRIAIIGTAGIAAEDHYFKPAETALRLMSVPVVFLLNLKLMLWPVALCADYNYPIRLAGDWFLAAPASWLSPWVLVGLGAMAGYGAAVAWLWRRHRPAALGLAWYGIALLPTSQLVPFGDLLAERFLYLPSVGLCYAVAAIVLDILWPRIRRAPASAGDRSMLNNYSPLIIITAIVLILLVARTIARNEVWTSPRAFWLAVQRDAPHNTEAPYGLAHAIAAERVETLARGNALRGAGRPAEGERWLARAAALEDEAIVAYEEAIRRTPDYLTAYLNLANLLFDSRAPQPARARALLANMIARAEDRPDMLFAGWARLGQHWVDEKSWAEAREAMERAAQHQEHPDALVLLGVACAQTGDLAAAEAAWRRALALDPAHANAQANLRKLKSRVME